MAGIIIANDPCSRCQAEQLFGHPNGNTMECSLFCLACGSFDKLEFVWKDKKPFYKVISFPLEQAALTIRLQNPAGEVCPVVWDSAIPEQADTAFIHLFRYGRWEDIQRQYPDLEIPNPVLIGRQFGTSAFCSIERRLAHPSRKDTLPYIRMSYDWNRLEIRRNAGQSELVVMKRKYISKSIVGGGMISVMDHQGDTQFSMMLPPGTTIRRAQRLWAAHSNEHTDFNNSYMTLMQDGKLQLLKGSLPERELLN